MKKLWLKYAAKIDALTARERALVLAAAVTVTVAIVFFAAIDPAQRRQRLLLAEMESQRAELAVMGKGALQAPDADAAYRTRAEALRQQIRAADEKLKAMERELVPAGRMTALLQEMVAHDTRLTVVSLRTLATEPLVPATDKAAADAKRDEPLKRETEDAHVFKHGVEITLQGTYANLHDYLTRLERSKWRMYWWRARLKADEDARLTLTVTVYTLSLDRAWLQV